MTREEIIKRGNEKFPQDIIEVINDDGSITREDVNFKLRKAYMEGLIDNNIPLPSNIDEAAEKCAGKVEFTANYNDEWINHEDIFNTFKSGAEWMAHQGQTLDSFIWMDEDDKLFIEAFVDENKFKMADNVIIQVRKKQ